MTNIMLRKDNGQYWMPLTKAIGICMAWSFVVYSFAR